MPRGGLLAKIAIVSGALSALMSSLFYSTENMRERSRARALVVSEKKVEGISHVTYTTFISASDLVVHGVLLD